MQSPLTTSARGLELIRSFEKFEPKAYLCPAGKLTIGYGHVIKASEPHLRSKTLTQAEAEALLRDDCRTVEIYLSAVLPDWVRSHHFDALVSFCFNCGVKAFDGSTLRVKIKQGDRQGAQGEFHKWIFSKGRRLRGLVVRRACEALMFAGCSDSTIETERRRLEALKGPL